MSQGSKSPHMKQMHRMSSGGSQGTLRAFSQRTMSVGSLISDIDTNYVENVVFYEAEKEPSESCKTLISQCDDSCNEFAKLVMKKAYQPQIKSDYCGLASICTMIKYCAHYLKHDNSNKNKNKNKNNSKDKSNSNSNLNITDDDDDDLNVKNLESQTFVYQNYVNHNLSTKHGISLLHLVQILSKMISDYNLPFCVSYEYCHDFEKFQTQFLHDIQLWLKAHSTQDTSNSTNTSSTPSSSNNDNTNNNSNNVNHNVYSSNTIEDEKTMDLINTASNSTATSTTHTGSSSRRNAKNRHKAFDDDKFNKIASDNGKYFWLLCNFYVRHSDERATAHWSPMINVTNNYANILLADVATHRIKPHFIPTEVIISLMNTMVRSTKLPRGYIKFYHASMAPYMDSVNNDYNFNNTHRYYPISNDRSIYIREASVNDALTLAQLQVRAWQEAYKNILDHKWLFESKQMTVSKKYEKWTEILTDDRATLDKHTFVLCQYPSKVLGYCTVSQTSNFTFNKIETSLRKTYKNNSLHIQGELCTLYLDPTTPRRKGYGSMLFDFGYEFVGAGFDWKKCVTKGLKKGKSFKNNTMMSMWVLYDNTVAMSFYTKKGCTIVSDHQRAHFGGITYRYTGLVAGLNQKK